MTTNQRMMIKLYCLYIYLSSTQFGLCYYQLYNSKTLLLGSTNLNTQPTIFQCNSCTQSIGDWIRKYRMWLLYLEAPVWWRLLTEINRWQDTR